MDIEGMLIQRHDPLINLGLAFYAELTEENATTLFRNGDETTKQALLSGPSVRSGHVSCWIDKDSEILSELLQSFDDNIKILWFLFANESIEHDLLVSLYERQEPFNELTDEQWFNAVNCSSLNQSLSCSSYQDLEREFLGFEYQRAFKAAWNLFEILPVNAKSARVLSQFGALLAPYGEVNIPKAPDDMDVPALIRRWEVDEPSDNWIETRDFRCCQFALRSLSRVHGIRSYPTQIGIRKAYELDKDGFLTVALKSDYPYRKEEHRRELAKCCDEQDSKEKYGYEIREYSNSFEWRLNYLQQKHPEWFPDSDGFYGMELDEIDDVGLRTERRLEGLEEEMKSISQKMQGLIEEQTSSALSQIYKAILWVMIIIIIGLIAILTKLY